MSLQTDIKAAFLTAKGDTTSSFDTQMTNLSTAIANAVITEIKSHTISIAGLQSNGAPFPNGTIN